MSRQKISEYTAKQALYPVFNLDFRGFALTPTTSAQALTAHFGDTNLVVKVDQGVKKRGKLGLVKLNLTPSGVLSAIKPWVKQGWTNFLVEPVLEHAPSAEHYLSLTRTRHGWDIIYSAVGGVEIESHWDQVNHALPTRVETFIHTHLLPKLDALHISFLEMNPILIRDSHLLPLDMAVEVDSAASPLPTLPDRVLTTSERAVMTLDHATPASLKYRLLSPNGRIWMLLSGGGASLVLADEVADLGLGSDLANYGEYSGAPTNDDVYAYTKIILQDLLASSLPPKKARRALIIAGGVANFTDVKKTFQGLIRALSEQQVALKQAKVKVYVRRGGPNEVAGLTAMQAFLTSAGLLGAVYGHATPLTQVISDAQEYLT